MDSSEVTVLIAGLAAIAFVLWYFFGEKRRTVVATGASGMQEVNVIVKGGYSPDMIVVAPNRPVRLVFHREETASCSEQIVFSDFGVSRNLPPFQTTTIELMPTKEGEFIFTCGMNMLRGKLIVERGPKGRT